MPSFDVVSEVDQEEVRNATDQASRELSTRFDFKGVDATFTYSKENVLVQADNEFQLDQMMDIFYKKLAKRGVDVKALELEKTEVNLARARLPVTFKQGLDGDAARKVVKDIKASKLKVQSQIQGDQVRVTGKKRDDLQKVMAMLKEGDYGRPLQYSNFRD